MSDNKTPGCVNKVLASIPYASAEYMCGHVNEISVFKSLQREMYQ